MSILRASKVYSVFNINITLILWRRRLVKALAFCAGDRDSIPSDGNLIFNTQNFQTSSINHVTNYKNKPY